jgi:uncharacterized alpha/beta hydrolase family protein
MMAFLAAADVVLLHLSRRRAMHLMLLLSVVKVAKKAQKATKKQEKTVVVPNTHIHSRGGKVGQKTLKL